MKNVTHFLCTNSLCGIIQEILGAPTGQVECGEGSENIFLCVDCKYTVMTLQKKIQIRTKEERGGG